MVRTEFQSPTGNLIENISLEEMKKYVIDEFTTYWEQGCGDGFIDYYVDDIRQSTLMIEPNNEYGIYLKYCDRRTRKEWLSLNDANALDEVAETATEIYASIGLFLSLDLAWEGIKNFLLTGERSDKIEWVRPNIIPEGGNY